MKKKTLQLFTLSFLILIIAFFSDHQKVTVAADAAPDDLEGIETYQNDQINQDDKNNESNKNSQNDQNDVSNKNNESDNNDASDNNDESNKNDESNNNDLPDYLGESGYLKAIPIDWVSAISGSTINGRTSESRNIPIMTGEGFNIPAEVLSHIAKSNTTLALHISNELTFSISGSDITRTDTSLQINLTAPGIPVDIKEKMTASASGICEFSMAEKKAYPFHINVHMNLGQENAGKLAMLYYYNETDHSLKLEGTFRVTESGQAMFGLKRGADYIAVVARQVKGYTIKDGDTLSHIAVRNGVSLNALRAANPQITDADKIRVGEIINIPTK